MQRATTKSAPRGDRHVLRAPGRFVPVPESRIGTKIGPAIRLHDFLISKQTSADGRVNYGRAIGYAWIRARWPGNPDDRPSERSLERWMATLKRLGLVTAKHDLMHAGMFIRLVGSVKFAPDERRAPEQLSLLGGPLSFPQPVEKAVEKPVEIAQQPPPKVAVSCRQNWRFKEVKKRSEETTRPHNPRALFPPPVSESPPGAGDPAGMHRWRLAQKARRIFREIESLRSIYVGAQGAQALARRDMRLAELHAELFESGWQDERAG